VRRRQLLQNHERGNFTIFQSEYPFHRSSSRRRFVRVSETLVAWRLCKNSTLSFSSNASAWGPARSRLHQATVL